MSLITRILPPDNKNAKLTFADMDNNLYYLQSLGVSGITFSSSTLTLTNPTGGTKTVTINDYYTTGATYSNGLIYFNRNDQLSAYTVNISSLTGDANTFITAVTYTSSANTITLTDNTNNSFNAYINSVSGLTVNGSLSATTLYGDGSNLTGISTQDTFVTGGTYSNGSAIFTNNTGGTFNVSGFYTGGTDNNQFTTGFTYSNNTFTILDNSGNTFNATINTVTGLTVNGTFSATTYQNLPLGVYGTGLTFNTGNYDLTIDGGDGVLDTVSLSILASDLTVTGGTYNPNNGIATFTNNTGGTFNVTGFLTGFTDTFVTGGTYSAGTITFTNTSGGTFDVTGLTINSGGGGTTVTGGTYSAGTATFTNSTGGTFSVSGFYDFPTAKTGTTIHFSSSTIFGTSSVPETGNISADLTNSKLGVIQKIYHNSSSSPSVPVTWVLLGGTTYQTNTLNIIYAEWSEGTRVEYWIVR